jgi:hypothetical protein
MRKHLILSSPKTPAEIEEPPIAGHGHSGYIYTNRLRDFDRDFRDGNLNDQVVMNHIRKTIRAYRPYREKISKWISDRPDFVSVFFQKGKHQQLGEIIKKVVKRSAHDRMVRDTARAILKAYRVPSKDFINEAGAIHNFVCRFMRYNFDTGEQFVLPYRMLADWAEGHDGSDCDCLSILYASLMTSIGWRNVNVVLVDGRGDGIISHACVSILMPRLNTMFGDKWVNVELTRGEMTQMTRLGWLPPHKYTKYLRIDVVQQPDENPKGERE